MSRKKESFGSRVRAVREGKGMSQREVAEASGMTYQALAKIERGATSNPTLDTIRSIADALGVKAGELIE